VKVKFMATSEEFQKQVAEPKKSTWTVPLIVVAVVAAAVTVLVLLASGVIPGLGAREKGPGEGGGSKGGGEVTIDPELEKEADTEFQKLKSSAEAMVGEDRFTEALAVYAAYPARFKGTKAGKRVEEEKGRIFNIALDWFRKRDDEMSHECDSGRFLDARKMAVEFAMALEKIRKEWREEASEDLDRIEERFAGHRSIIDTRASEVDYMDGLEPRLENIAKEEEVAVLQKLTELSGNPSKTISGRARDLLSRFEPIRKNRAEKEEIRSFEIAGKQAEALLKQGKADEAEAFYLRFEGSSLAQVKRGVETGLARVTVFREELARFAEALRMARDGKDTFSGIEAGRKAIEAFAVSRIDFIQEKAKGAIREMEGAETALIGSLKEKGFAVIDAFSGTLGSDDSACGNPKRTVRVDRFAIGLREVTCGEYASFLKEAGYPSLPGWKEGQVPDGAYNLPVTRVSASDAEAYCAWVSKRLGMKIRLSTDDEWEIAACRDSGALRKFPWGDEFDAGAANLAGEGPGAAGSFPKDLSACGAMDMAGNVCEWVKTASGGYAARGGCFDDGGSPVSARCAFRTEMSGREKSRRVGFRVAVELK